jgi:hypothetical protein
MLFEGLLQCCRLSAGGWRSHMSAHNPVGVIPASKTVRRTIEVAVLRGTLENCTLDCMRRANLRHSNTDSAASSSPTRFRRSRAPLCAWGKKNKEHVLKEKFPQKEVV